MRRRLDAPGRALVILPSLLIFAVVAPSLGAQSAMRVSLGDLDDHPTRYLGRVITVEAEVDDVYGPRLFTIDDPAWGDLGGEVLVYAPGTAAVTVKDEDPVTVTGMLQTVALAKIDGEWGWQKVETDVDVDFLNKPLVIASRITTSGGREVYGGSGPPATEPAAPLTIMDLALVAAGTEDLTGRPVHLRNVRVLRLASQHGFFVDAQAGAVFVLPEQLGVPVMVGPGDVVSIQGVIAQAPRRMPGEFNPPVGWNRRIYVVATTVSK